MTQAAKGGRERSGVEDRDHRAAGHHTAQMTASSAGTGPRELPSLDPEQRANPAHLSTRRK